MVINMDKNQIVWSLPIRICIGLFITCLAYLATFNYIGGHKEVAAVVAIFLFIF